MVQPKKLWAIKKPLPLTRRRRDFKYIEHICSDECSILENKLIEDNPNKFILTNDSILVEDQSPFLVPLYFEFKRKNENDNNCAYLTPCGVEIDNLADIYKYLKISGSKLNVNQFTFKARIELFRDHSYFRVYALKKDISNGLESLPIQLINEFAPEFKIDFTYIKESFFSDELNSLADEENLEFCKCEEDCSDLEKCKCRQLTILENKPLSSNAQGKKIGYEFNYLFNETRTAIFECNSKCKCKNNCLNRVVQNGLKVRLQVFMTKNKGFGVRVLHDVPMGSYICSYEGKICKNTRTEKELYNVFLMNINYDYAYKKYLTGNNETHQKDDLFEDNLNKNNLKSSNEKLNQEVEKPSENSKLVQLQDLVYLSDSEESESNTSFSDLTDSDINDTSDEDNTLKESIFLKVDKKKLENNDEPDQMVDSDYLIDAKDFGNVSRFFNHSCNGNLFVQPVFEKTQNRLFPKYCFFASKDIKAFSELTFNYFSEEYEEEKLEFNCKCKSKKCLSKTKQ